MSRVNDVVSDDHKKAAGAIRNLLAIYTKNEDLINIGAYVSGSDPACDKAIALMDNINNFLKQSTKDKINYEQSVNDLMQLGQLDPSDVLARNTPQIGLSPSVVNNEIKLTLEVGEVVHIDTVTNDTMPNLTKAVEKQLDKYMKNINNNIRKYAR